MGRIVAQLFVSLDGVHEAPEIWHFPFYDESMAASVRAQIDGADAMLLGRKTYEVFAASWPGRGSEVPLADRINAMPKIVVSRTLTGADWQNTVVVAEDVVARLMKLKTEYEHITVSGSPTLVRWLLGEGLLDELQLLVHPVLLGRGRRLFEGAEAQRRVELVRSEAFPSGVLELTYRP